MPSQLLPSAGCCTECTDDPVTVNVPGPQGPAGTNGTNGTNGANAYTTLAGKFTIPALGATGSVTVVDGTPIPTSASGQIWVAITGGGYFQVMSKVGNVLTLKNPAAGVLAVANTAAGVDISAGTLLAVAGGTGAVGTPGASGAPINARYLVTIADGTLTNEVALETFTGGYIKTAGSGGSGAVSTVTTIPVADILGTLPVSKGGTGITTTPANGQIPIGNGTNYVAATITAGSGVTVTNGAGTITISAPTSGYTPSAFSRRVTGNSSGGAPLLSSGVAANPFNSTTYGSATYAIIDTASGFNPANGRYTVQTTGTYRFSTCLNLEAVATSGSCVVEILKNGSSVISTFALVVASTGAQLFQLEYFDTATAPTDYFEVRTTSTQDMYVENGSSFSAIRVA
jgi:hypothetical protein